MEYRRKNTVSNVLLQVSSVCECEKLGCKGGGADEENSYLNTTYFGIKK